MKKLIEPKHISEIQKSLGRPKNLTTASHEDLYTYAKRLEKTVNSRIRRLSQKIGGDAYEIRRLKDDLSAIVTFDPITTAGYVRTKDTDARDLRPLIKAMERFLHAAGSTITGIRQSADVLGSFAQKRYGFTDEEMAAIYQHNQTTGFHADTLYEIERQAASDQARGFTFEEFLRDIDADVVMIDDDLIPVIRRVWDKVANS